MTDLPYLVEYAKSSRSSCKNCHSSIMKDSLRIATVVQSPVFDGAITKWYHPNCFFIKQRPKSSADIANFDAIRWEDQQDIKKNIEEAGKLPAPTKKGKKRGKGADVSSDFSIEYAKSSRAMCRGCEEKILKEEIRISKKDFESEEARRYGGLDRWYHLQCFVKLRKELEFFDQADSLAGIKSLSKDDQANVKKELPKISNENVPAVKKCKEEPEDMEEENKLKEQNKQIFAMRDTLSSLNKTELIEILEMNKQQVPQGVSAILDFTSDLLIFGALKPCPKCKGQLVYVSGLGYKCTGDLTEWTKCEYVTQDPKRQKCSVPEDLKNTYKALAFKPKVVKRLIKVTAPSTSSAVKKEDDDVDAGPKIKTNPRPLKNMQFVILGSTEKSKEVLKKEIALLGGAVTTKIHEDLAAVISNPKEIKKMNKKMEDAKVLDIQVVSEDFVEEAKDYTELAIALIKKKTISDWGGDVKNRLAKVIEKSGSSKSKSKFEKSSSGKVKLQVKGGGTVDLDSGLEDCAHVYQNGKNKYTATLGITDIQAKKNSYYKLQILKHDTLSKYWLFRSWGRIGTTIGDTKLEDMPLKDCIEKFEQLYEEKSGNNWHNRKHFVKVPHKLYPIDIDQGDVEDNKLLDSDIKSNLEKPIQDLMRLIFNVENMRKVMLEFEIDMDKMPLGKISKKQIQKAYSILTELQELVATSIPERTTLIDASNRFYTLIPHNFGISGPKILETVEEIKMKCEMLEALLEMEIAYSLLHNNTDEKKNPLDAHYEQLKTKIEVLDKSSKDFEVIKQYVKNTHAATHSHYELVIDDVFVIKRQGEDQRYKPFKKLPNKKLLWHGSRTTNFAGILSQGLRIAPPEAPVTGYMFGKGIYFADMVSKSANYCCTNTQNPTGLLLLCEVALGNMYERYEADYIEKLPKDKHSTMGRGQTQPDPSIVHKMDDSVEVPYGPPVQAKLNKKSALLYNEYIVYDTAQVKARYLVKMNFKYKM